MLLGNQIHWTGPNLPYLKLEIVIQSKLPSVCSFLPAATRMIYDMNLQDHLLGVTFECPEGALKEKRVVVRCLVEGMDSSSSEIDRIFSASKANGEFLYYIDEKVFKDINPDILFTQDTCEVCQIDSKCTEAAVSRLNKHAEIISLSPVNLEGVYETAFTIAKALGRVEQASLYISSLKKRTGDISDLLIKKGIQAKSVMLMEWMDPVYHCGHWIPEQIALAGGIDKLGAAGRHSSTVPWENILNYDPEILLIAPCGFEVERTRKELQVLEKQRGWRGLTAVRNERVYLIDFDLFTQPSAGTLVDGIELMAALIHPEYFPVPAQLHLKFLQLKN
jgi:iron complex transport system substrate-binding protein